MKPQKQKIFHKGNGDCFRACMASILELSNNNKLPHISSSTWFVDWLKFLNKMGMGLSYGTNCWRDGYWVASVKSKNFPEPITHAIVMKGQCVVFDPSLHKKYKIGRNLLSTNLVKYGYWLEITDVSKLINYLKLHNQ